jgi:hypothetical protein
VPRPMVALTNVVLIGGSVIILVVGAAAAIVRCRRSLRARIRGSKLPRADPDERCEGRAEGTAVSRTLGIAEPKGAAASPNPQHESGTHAEINTKHAPIEKVKEDAHRSIQMASSRHE